jgi:hypothetical protein
MESVIQEASLELNFSYRRNIVSIDHFKDGLISWMKDMLTHSFVLDAKVSYLDTMDFFEQASLSFSPFDYYY